MMLICPKCGKFQRVTGNTRRMTCCQICGADFIPTQTLFQTWKELSEQGRYAWEHTLLELYVFPDPRFERALYKEYSSRETGSLYGLHYCDKDSGA